MNIVYGESAQEKRRIPEVGEVWRHENDDSIYMRIVADSFLLNEEKINEETEFYSIRLNGRNEVTHTLLSSGNSIEILEYEMKIKGVKK